jgi:cobalt-zinc-cadmium efflux system membrane fusion protein
MHSKSIFIFLLIFNAVACTTTQKEPASEDTLPPENTDSLFVNSLSEEEMATIQTMKLKKIRLPDSIECTGRVTALPGNKYSVSPAVEGFVKEIYHKPGDKVKKGEPLALLSHTSYLKLQEKYLTAKSQYNYYKANFTRQGELAIESAGSLKNMQKAKGMYEKFNIQTKSLEKQLEMLNIEPQSLDAESLSSTITLFAPATGIISEYYLTTGQLADDKNPLCQIVDNRKLAIEFSIPAKYMQQIDKSIRLNVHSSQDKPFKSDIHQINKTVQSSEETFTIYTGIKNKTNEFYPGMRVHAVISVDSSFHYAIPKSAIVTHNKDKWVFVKSSGDYQLKQIKTGQQRDGYYTVQNYQDLLNQEIVTKGSRMLYKNIKGQ